MESEGVGVSGGDESIMRLGLDVSNWQGIITPMRLAAAGVKKPDTVMSQQVDSILREFPAAGKIWMDEGENASIAMVSPETYVPASSSDVSCWMANGRDTIIIRASLETEQKKQQALQQIDVCLAGGMDVSVYGWVYWDWGPEVTANAISELVGNRPIRWLWWDLEEEHGVPGADKMMLWMKQAINETERLGLNTGTYTGAWYWNKYLRGRHDLNNRPLWDANYSQTPYQGLISYGGWDPRLVFAHQYTSSMQLCGRELDGNGHSEYYYLYPPRGAQVPPPVPGQVDWAKLKPLMDAVYDSNSVTIHQAQHTENDLKALYEEARRQGMPS
jgi:hypothetical protein